MSLIRDYWTAMNGNDWRAVAEHFLAEDYLCLWPQTNEVIRGRDEFVRVNQGLVGQDGWLFEVIRIIQEGDHVASDVRILNRDEGIIARAATFHDLAGGRIAKQVEFWSYPNSIPDWRRDVLARDPDLAKF